MIRLRQHVPAFVNDGEGGWSLSAPTLDELLSLPQVQSYAHDTEPIEREGTVTGWVNGDKKTVTIIHPAPEEERFYRFSLSDRNTLMAEYNRGDRFWVIGYLSADDPREFTDHLPVWRETDTARIRRERWNQGIMEPQRLYRCKKHGVEEALCCLPRSRP